MYKKDLDYLIHEIYSQKGFNNKTPDWQKYHKAHHTGPKDVAEIANLLKPKNLFAEKNGIDKNKAINFITDNTKINFLKSSKFIEKEFKNDKENERQPDFRGTVNVGGTDYQLAAWVKTSDKVGKYFSLSVSESQKQTKKEAVATEEDPF